MAPWRTRISGEGSPICHLQCLGSMWMPGRQEAALHKARAEWAHTPRCLSGLQKTWQPLVTSPVSGWKLMHRENLQPAECPQMACMGAGRIILTLDPVLFPLVLILSVAWLQGKSPLGLECCYLKMRLLLPASSCLKETFSTWDMKKFKIGRQQVLVLDLTLWDLGQVTFPV